MIFHYENIRQRAATSEEPRMRKDAPVVQLAGMRTVPADPRLGCADVNRWKGAANEPHA